MVNKTEGIVSHVDLKPKDYATVPFYLLELESVQYAAGPYTNGRRNVAYYELPPNWKRRKVLPSSVRMYTFQVGRSTTSQVNGEKNAQVYEGLVSLFQGEDKIPYYTKERLRGNRWGKS